MSAPRARSHWPLVGKELMEQAARKRTYVLRTLYAAALFAAFLFVFYSWLREGGANPSALIGRGRDLFLHIVLFQFLGIFIFLPAMMCSAITAEKERDSLALLLLTDMTPRQIIREKYVGRLVPMFIYLFLSMPLMALAYAMGGVAAVDITCAAYFLFLTCLQVGAMALMFSAYCRTTVGAFLATYIVGGAICLIPFLRPMTLYFEASQRGAMLLPVLVVSILPWVSVLFFLSLARRFLLTRAAVPPTNRLLSFFRALDRFWNGVNQNFGGVVLIRESHDLPGGQPVYWRETQRKSLGKLNYLFRILVTIEGPVVLIGLFMAFMRMGWHNEAVGLSIMLAVLWGIAALAVVVRGADLIVSERSSQTLETLLTTPMSGAQILSEKMLSVYRLVLVLSIPILTTVLIEGHLESEMRGHGFDGYAWYVFFSIVSVFVYLPLFAWVSLWIGLKAQSRVRAIIAALLVAVAWCTMPVVAAATVRMLWHADAEGAAILLYLSPAYIVTAMENSAFRVPENDSGFFAVLLVHYLLYAVILFVVRFWCLRHADALLGRLKVTGRPRRGEVAPAAEDSVATS